MKRMEEDGRGWKRMEEETAEGLFSQVLKIREIRG
jgi:hypothetical protein